MYDLSNCYTNTFEVLQYTIAVMHEVGFSKNEIDDYMIEATNSDNAHLIDVSIEYINKCNELTNMYNRLYEDDSFYIDDKDDDYTFYNKQHLLAEESDDEYHGYSYNENKYNYDTECYEGFNDCKNRMYTKSYYDWDF